METINDAPRAPKPVGAYSQAVIYQGVVYCAGQIGIDPETSQLVPGGLDEQTKQVLSNLAAVLSFAGSSPKKILMSTIFLAEISDAQKVNAIYSEFVDKDSPPARQTVAVRALPLGALVEISVIAAKS